MQGYTKEIIYITLALAAFGGGIFWSAIRNHRRARKVQDTPRSKVGSAPQGYVELEGFAWPASDVFAAHDGYKAVYYSFLLQREEVRGSGKNKRRTWVTVFSVCHGGHFYLADATGLALIDWKNAEKNLDGGRTVLWRNLNESEQRRILEKVVGKAVSGFPPSGKFLGLLDSKYRIVENEVLVGSPIYACGHFATATADIQNVKRPGLTQFCERVFDPQTRNPKDLRHLLDRDRNQKISPEESQYGYAMAARGACHAAETQNTPEKEFQVFGTVTSSPAHPLMFADVHEHHFVDRLTRWLWLKFAAGAACLAAAGLLAINPGAFIEMGRNKSSQHQTVFPAGDSAWVMLHESCVNGTGGGHACEVLIDKSSELQLSTDYVKYYRARACELGNAGYCEQ